MGRQDRIVHMQRVLEHNERKCEQQAKAEREIREIFERLQSADLCAAAREKERS